jgi:hypothetical protein
MFQGHEIQSGSQTHRLESRQTGTYAVVVKTYVWNSFVARQVARIAERVGSGDVWVLVDESRGPLQGITHPRVLRVTETQAVALGLVDAKTGNSLFWYCSDYLHVLFVHAYPDYGHYIFVEHDVGARIDFDAFAASLAAEDIDYVGTPLRTSKAAYPWLAGLLTIYRAEEIRSDLYCFAAFSQRAVRILGSKRIEMSAAYEDGSLSTWPIGEVFIPTEIERAGLNRRELETYGDTSRYDWWPPSHEDELSTMPTPSFAHPVLEGTPYLKSALRHAKVTDWLRRGSPVQKGFQRYGVPVCVPHLLRELRRRSIEAMRRKLEDLGFASRWTAGIEGRQPDASGTVQG